MRMVSIAKLVLPLDGFKNITIFIEDYSNMLFFYFSFFFITKNDIIELKG